MSLWITSWGKSTNSPKCKERTGQVILARSATTDFDEQERIVGSLDVPVNVRGQAELVEMVGEWRSLAIDVIYCTAGEAETESAKFLADKLGVKLRVLECRNQDFGLWQGLPLDEVRRKHPKVYRQWDENPCAICPPAGEMLDEVCARVRQALKPVLKRSQTGLIVIVAPDPLRQVIRGFLKREEFSASGVQDASQKTWETIDI